MGKGGYSPYHPSTRKRGAYRIKVISRKLYDNREAKRLRRLRRNQIRKRNNLVIQILVGVAIIAIFFTIIYFS